MVIEKDGDRGLRPAAHQTRETLADHLLDDGSDWVNLACTRVAAVGLAGIAAILVVAEMVR